MLKACKLYGEKLKKSRKTKILLGLAIIVMAWLTIYQTKLLAILITLGITGTIILFMSKNEIPVDMTPIFFFTILFTNIFGFGYGVLYALLSFTLGLVLGRQVDPLIFIYALELLGLAAISMLFVPFGFVTMGIIMSGIEIAASIALNLAVGRELGEFFGKSLFSMALNITLFVTLTRFVVPLLEMAA